MTKNKFETTKMLTKYSFIPLLIIIIATAVWITGGLLWIVFLIINIITISLGVLIGLIGALYFLVLFLMEDATLPSIYMPLGIFFGILGLFIGLSWWSAKLLTNKYFIQPFEE